MRYTRLFISIVLGACTPVMAADSVPWPEHPRPDFQRPAWLNLNGEWGFDFDPQDLGEKEQWFNPGRHEFSRKITVPFPWESKLSGIGDTEYKGVAWYSREVTIPDGEGWKGKDAWLIVGACDWEATVWINGQKAGPNPGPTHVGGYVPFEVELSEFAKPGEQITIAIRVKDITDPHQPTGKQVGWYTRTSGIWQTVYLESRGRSHLRTLQTLPSIADGLVICHLEYRGLAKGDRITVSSPDSEFESSDWAFAGTGTENRATVPARVAIPNPKLWTPDSPKLYPVRFELRRDGKTMDVVDSYFGLREVSIAKAPGREYQYICLNGKPIYLAGALHQSFHPDGIYQYPHDATVRGDYELCKRIGINMLRIHIKTPVPRELYWADKLGVLIMQDIPNFWEHNAQARTWYEEMLAAAIGRDFNHPSIFAWVDFNETWGLNNPGGYDAQRQKWVAGIYERTKQLDPTRPVEDNSPCNYDHVITDINSWHFYINDYEKAKAHIQGVVDKTYPGSEFNYAKGFKQRNDPLMNSEYGGISAGLGDQDISWCFKYLTNELRKHDKICGYIYTELSDIEWEHNGFVNYDRSPKEYHYDHWHPGFSLKDINGLDFIVLDVPPCLTLKAGDMATVPVAISHWSGRDAADLRLRFRVAGLEESTADWQVRPAKWRPYAVTTQEPIFLRMPAKTKGSRLGALQVELIDGDAVLARNYVNVWLQGPSPRIEALSIMHAALRFEPSDYSAWQWEAPAPVSEGIAAEKVWAPGSGYLEYELKVPADLDLKDVASLTLKAEMSAKAGDEKLDWPARKRTVDYPQTDVTKWPTDIRISINGVKFIDYTLPDDPADARGVLSHVHQFHPGSYGEMPAFEVSGEQLRRMLERSEKGRITLRFEVPQDAPQKGGLAIFGDRLGAHPVDPTVTLAFSKPHGLPADYASNDPVAVNRLMTQRKVVIPSAENGGHTWRYAMSKPPDDWMKQGFDDSSWKSGKGGFGQPETPNSIIGTRWKNSDIWLRTEIELPDPASIVGGEWRVYHDEDFELYVNGRKVLSREGHVTRYVGIPLDAEAKQALRAGKNVIAVHCHQAGGGQNIDVGLIVVRPREP